MGKIFLTSDWHFRHDREFIWKPRGFSSVDEMNEEIIKRHNEVVTDDDIVYVLGDLMLGQDKERGLECIGRLRGTKIVIAGNHDTPARREAYKNFGLTVYDALLIKENGYHFYLSHYPTITSNLEKESLKQCVLNCYGHTHQQTNFYNDIPMIYHVGIDSHNCYPCELGSIIEEIKAKVKECKEFL